MAVLRQVVSLHVDYQGVSKEHLLCLLVNQKSLCAFSFGLNSPRFMSVIEYFVYFINNLYIGGFQLKRKIILLTFSCALRRGGELMFWFMVLVLELLSV